MTPRSRFAQLTIAAVFVLIALPVITLIADDAVDLGKINDGPYLFWQPDSSAAVYYVCDGELRADTLAPADTLRIMADCDGSTWLRIPTVRPTPPPDSFANVEKIVAVSDIHGEYDAFVDILRTCGVIDSDGKWAFGAGHLVVDGDVFDRGDGVTESLWLIYRLEQEALAAGGRVHFTLGNHEAMVLRGDERYVNDKYLRGIVARTGIEYRNLYGPKTELGRWLRTRPTMVRINDVLFVHGGLSPELMGKELGRGEVNRKMWEALDLDSDGLRSDTLAAFLLKSYGPLWYRGMLRDYKDRYDRLDSSQVAAVLESYGVSAVVLGHSELDEVKPHYGGLVYSVDVPLEDLGSFQALLWEDGQFYRISGTGERRPL